MRRTSNSHLIADSLKEQRRVEGRARKERWQGLTMEEKLEQLAGQRGESRKQVFRLTGRDMSAADALALIRSPDTNEGETL
jgi:hypothetical protein